MGFISTLIWMLVVIFSMDKMTMCFKVHHVDKIGMTYKPEGGELHTDALFKKGYTYQMFICNDNTSKHIYLKGFRHLIL